jgi:hypothetical protein
LGIESIAADPVKPDRVYMAVGMYSQSWAGLGTMLRSDDRGGTFTQFEIPIKMGGNEDGRSNGEKLAVDPHQPKILFFGSRRNGLWKSRDEAASWKKVETLPPRWTTRVSASRSSLSTRAARRVSPRARSTSG